MTPPDAPPTASSLPVLEQLFGEALGAFLRDGWPDRFFVHRGPVERLSRLRESGDLDDVPSLLAWAHRSGYRGFFAAFPSSRDEIESAEGLDARQARAALRSGMTVGASGLAQAAPELRWFVTGLRKELGLPPGAQVRALAYGSPPGEATSLHFDQNANIVVQMSGEKRWLLAPNAHVAHPTDRYSTRGHVSAALADYAPRLPRELTSEERASAHDVLLRPGDVLFVPRGFWHATEAVATSLQINFTTSCPSWADLLADALRRRLSQLPSWRELADGAGSRDPSRRRSAQERLEALLTGLPEILASLDGEAIIDHAHAWHRITSESRDPAPSFFRYVRSPGATVVQHGLLVEVRAGEEPSTITLEEGLEDDFSELVGWLDRREPHQPFSADDVVADAPWLARSKIGKWLEVLRRHGALALSA